MTDSPRNMCRTAGTLLLVTACMSCAMPPAGPGGEPLATAGTATDFMSPDYPDAVPLPRTRGRHAPSPAPAAAVVAAPIEQPSPLLDFRPGMYRCELNRSVLVRHVSPDRTTAVLHWAKKDYTLRAVHARSGALRYEDAKSGLMFIVIVGKSLLLDTKKGAQLANECRL